MWEKLKGYVKGILQQICDIIEVILALLVIAGIVAAIAGLIPQLGGFWADRMETGTLIRFLELVFDIVIGVEFLKMLCKPDADTIVEVLIFLVARHMIIEDTTALEDLLSITSMGILFAIKKYINAPAKRAGLGYFFTGRHKSAEEKRLLEEIRLEEERQRLEKLKKEGEQEAQR